MGPTLRAAERLYRTLLFAYPPTFRRAWGRQMVETFRDASRDAARAGKVALALFWLRAALDLAQSAAAERRLARERSRAMTGNGSVVSALTVLAAPAIGWMCLHTDETGILAGSLMLTSFLLAFASPRRAWLAALLGLAAPAAQAIAHLRGWTVPYPNDWPEVATAFVACVFSIAAAIGGALCGWTLARLRREAA
jgi:hypothetical protein